MSRNSQKKYLGDKWRCPFDSLAVKLISSLLISIEFRLVFDQKTRIPPKIAGLDFIDLIFTLVSRVTQ